MDWKKSKTILIVALLITNIFLLSALYLDRYSQTALRESNEIISKLLEEKNIKIDVQLPDVQMSEKPLTVEYKGMDIYLLNQTFFSGLGEVEYTDDEQTVLVRGVEKITVTNGQSLVYENEILDTSGIEQSEEDAFTKAISFLVAHSYDTKDMMLISSQKVGRTYEFIFAKTYNDHLVLSSNMSLKVNASGVKRMERYWPAVIEEGSVDIELTHSSKAILSLLDMSEAYGKTVVGMELCYYYNARDLGFVKKMTEASRGRALPAWFVKFSDGSFTVIDNY